MDYSFREIVASNPLLYRIYVHTLRNRKGNRVRLPSANDDLYLGGYPRSGNTYFTGLTISLYPHLNFASHLHVTAGIKIALKKKLTTFILIRKPKNTIISWVCRKVFLDNAELNQRFVDEKLKQYINYYNFVLLNKNNLEILKFEELIGNQLKYMKIIAKVLEEKVHSIDEFENIFDDYNKKMRLKEERKNEGASSLPNKKREEFKEKNVWMVEESKHYDEAVNIYRNLII